MQMLAKSYRGEEIVWSPSRIVSRSALWVKGWCLLFHLETTSPDGKGKGNVYGPAWEKGAGIQLEGGIAGKGLRLFPGVVQRKVAGAVFLSRRFHFYLSDGGGRLQQIRERVPRRAGRDSRRQRRLHRQPSQMGGGTWGCGISAAQRRNESGEPCL